MATPINLNKARKAKARADKRAKGDTNAAKFGRTKAERALEADRDKRAQRFLDQHRRDEE
ncbi:DUF4169 family protein [Ovoidimarina sediminis]|uniref:DUF4169 family protein n=1 Tax=Ovoidimarina sediminis TaxID=3079856 RepID=UPI0029144B9E|nr:DUF4169 family protein [Rhodophyticola sp. MJ-SS7]MDU8944857.1 DUF4169 family protein [Rhodophyticola sp. MJ-SS7]